MSYIKSGVESIVKIIKDENIEKALKENGVEIRAFYIDNMGFGSLVYQLDEKLVKSAIGENLYALKGALESACEQLEEMDPKNYKKKKLLKVLFNGGNLLRGYKDRDLAERVFIDR